MRDASPGPAWLFCPADRPDRYGKALAAADVVILDLEDAVAPAAKASAREALRGLAADGIVDWARTVVRVNGADTVDHAADLALTQDIGVRTVMLSKSERADDVRAVPHDVVLLLETPAGIRDADELASVDNVVAVMWGADDLVAGLGGTSSRFPDGRYRDLARHARARALLAAKAAGRLALDAVHMDIPDTAGLAAECEDAVASGFDATVAIHPTQVAVIRRSYAPDAERVVWAEQLLAHVGDDRSVTTFRGRMVDGPIYAQAERVLRLAAATSGGR
ncbi:aldolase/citrate lyase family protein [Aeromicrobium sp.]|jgi:citrate lyase subunit beta/citryl-CoA lyase|uniref:HpcH/HpaI aldolase/citrate lyase family protein n=1 Tax=Aeromicrobium sp. TaxID=1871063 RepID=UPI0025BD62BA|nr:aldolase/citrate lyase family protein [Aeromicrobium sp.]MCK5890320.1 CoA ester lyase [Aeromicrobium sp.]